MYRIIIGMDVYCTDYILCAVEPVIDAEDRVFAQIKATRGYNFDIH